MCKITACCCCVEPFHGVRLIPLADLFELLFAIAYLTNGYLLQDTWLAHATVLIIGNTLSSFIKLLACLPTLTVNSDHEIINQRSWPFKCFYYFRIIGFLFSLLSIATQLSLSIYGINNSNFYDDIQYGFCSSCYRTKLCLTNYQTMIMTNYQTMVNQTSSDSVVKNTTIETLN